jgi:glycosyltransferase involved in cell wall biosynthesis
MSFLPATFTLSIAGDGRERVRLEFLCKELSIADRVSFLGIVEPGLIGDLYQTHDLFVLPSQREGCPNVVSEAQSFALPVVAFDIPGMKEFVRETNGIIVSKRDPEMLAYAIKDLCTDPERLHSFGVDGYNTVRREREFDGQFQKLVTLFSGGE